MSESLRRCAEAVNVRVWGRREHCKLLTAGRSLSGLNLDAIERFEGGSLTLRREEVVRMVTDGLCPFENQLANQNSADLIYHLEWRVRNF